MNSFSDSDSSVRGGGDDPALAQLLRATYAAPTDSSYWTGFEQRLVTQIEHTSLLQEAYAAPADPSYWAGLEQRIVSRIRDNGVVAWWTVFSEWRTAGMVAAAAAFFLVGATTIREQQKAEAELERAAMAIEASPYDTNVEPINIAITPPSAKERRNAAPERYLDLIRP